jgi:hypothetical protein
MQNATMAYSEKGNRVGIEPCDPVAAEEEELNFNFKESLVLLYCTT